MSGYDFVYAFTGLALVFGATVAYYRISTWLARLEDNIEGVNASLQNHFNMPHGGDDQHKYTEVHRKMLEHQALIENLELRLTDTRDIFERRFNRLSTRQSRADREAEEELPEPVSEEDVHQLHMDLGGAQNNVQQAPERRGRLVRKTGRDPYRR